MSRKEKRKAEGDGSRVKSRGRGVPRGVSY